MRGPGTSGDQARCPHFLIPGPGTLVLQKVPSEFYPKVCNHGEGPYLNVKALVGVFNQEKALIGAFSVITNLRMDLHFKL